MGCGDDVGLDEIGAKVTGAVVVGAAVGSIGAPVGALDIVGKEGAKVVVVTSVETTTMPSIVFPLARIA
jgi:hypothetical protein